MVLTSLGKASTVYTVDMGGTLIAKTTELSMPHWAKIAEADDFAAGFHITSFVPDPWYPNYAAYVVGHIGAVPYLFYLENIAGTLGEQIITELWNGSGLSVVALHGFAVVVSPTINGAVYGALSYQTSADSYLRLVRREGRDMAFSIVQVASSSTTNTGSYESPCIDIGKHAQEAASLRVAIGGAEGTLHESIDGGNTFTIVRNTDSAAFNYRGVNYPFADNSNDEVLLAGTEVGADGKLYIRQSGVWTEITPNPLVTGDYVGLAPGNHAIYTFMQGREFISTIGLSGNTSALNTSQDSGSAWSGQGLVRDIGIVPQYTTYQKSVLRDSFVHYFNSGYTTGSYTLISGNPYIIRLVGWGGWAWPGSYWGEADAAYAWYGNTSTPDSPSGPASFILFNGAWDDPSTLIDPAYNDAHDYEFYYVGTGTPFSIGFDTGNPWDNHGSWNVEIYDAVPVMVNGSDNRFYTAGASGFEPYNDGTNDRAVFVSGYGFTDAWEAHGSAGEGIHIQYDFGGNVNLTSVKVSFKTRFVGTNPKVTAALDGDIFGNPATGSMISALFTGNAVGRVLRIDADPNDGGSEDTDNYIMSVTLHFEPLDETTGVDGWPYDHNVLWLSGSWIFNGNKGIFWTNDYGATWNNMIGDWETAIGTFQGVANLVPVAYFIPEPTHEGPAYWPISYAGDDDKTAPSGISYARGERRIQMVDLAVNSTPEPLTFSRIYRQSKQADFRFMGTGWTHNHHITLTKLGGTPEKLLVLLPSGGTVQFTASGTNTFQGDPGSSSKIVYDAANNCYTLTAEDQSRFEFEQTEDSNLYRLHYRYWTGGEIWTYTYQGTSDKLSSVSDGQGRSLTFAYYTSGDWIGLLERVQDHINRQVELDYGRVNNLYMLHSVSDVQ